MKMSKKFDLKWQAFMFHGRDLFKELRKTQKYSDVTLVTGDQHQFNTHKFILSGCSTVFKEILDRSPLNSTIYLRGVKQKELESILDFVYLGEATIDQEKLKTFLNVAKDLNITDIGDIGSDTNDVKENFDVVFHEDEEVSDDIQKNPSNENKDNDYERNEKNDFEINNKLDLKKIVENKAFPVDSKIFEDISVGLHFCDICDKKFSNKYSLKAHNKYQHLKVLGVAPFHCDICNMNFSSKGNLKKHNEAQHLKLLYPCKQCDYQASYTDNLKQHVQIQHEDIKYSCKECSYQASSKSNLTVHFKRQHSSKSKLE